MNKLDGKRMIALSLLTAFLMSGCATPTVINERIAGDERMTCSELVAAIDEAREYEEDAREDRGLNTTNIAAAVFFLPGLVGTYLNTEEAIEAAEDRQEYLTELYEDKSCDAQ